MLNGTFEELRDKALEDLGKFYDVRPETLTNKTNGDYSIERTWKVKTEIEIFDKITDIEFIVKFDTDFPLSFPNIYLSKEDYNLYCSFPHIDSNKFICTFDKQKSRPDFNKPSEVLYQSIQQAKKIIKDGAEQKNFEDYDSEFIAYWKSRYENGLIRSISLIDEDNASPKNIKLYQIKPLFLGYELLLVSDEFNPDNFIKFLKNKKHSLEEIKCFYIDNVDFENQNVLLNNKQTVEIISKKGLLEDFKQYVNSKNKVVLFRKVIDDRNIYLGWINRYTKKHNGFRTDKYSIFELITKLDGNNKVQGIVTESFTFNRFSTRSSYILNSAPYKYKYLIAGLGSIGSNLTNILRTFNPGSFVFVDNDFMQAENTNRHLLGIDSIHKNKVDAMKEFIANISPNLDIYTFNNKITDVVINENGLVNSQDYLFVCIGEINQELWLDNAMKNKLITKPIFYLWVEPYLAAGHCIYIHPDSNVRFTDLFASNSFNYNVISEEDYKEHKFVKRETGCSTSFIPYSNSNVTLFLSSITKNIFDIITKNPKESVCISWIGDLEAIMKIGLNLSSFGQDKEFGEVILNTINENHSKEK